MSRNTRPIGKEIIALLEHNGSLSLQELSDQLGLPAPIVSTAITDLRKSGVEVYTIGGGSLWKYELGPLEIVKEL